MTIDLATVFHGDGTGVLATSGPGGTVNTAVFSHPRIMPDGQLVWGTTDGRTYRNLLANPSASFLWRKTGPGWQGVRLQLKMTRHEEAGPMLAEIRDNTSLVVGPGAGRAVTHALWFRVEEHRPLV